MIRIIALLALVITSFAYAQPRPTTELVAEKYEADGKVFQEKYKKVQKAYKGYTEKYLGIEVGDAFIGNTLMMTWMAGESVIKYAFSDIREFIVIEGIARAAGTDMVFAGFMSGNKIFRETVKSQVKKKALYRAGIYFSRALGIVGAVLFFSDLMERSKTSEGTLGEYYTTRDGVDQGMKLDPDTAWDTASQSPKYRGFIHKLYERLKFNKDK